MDYFLKREFGLSVKNFSEYNLINPTIPNRFVALLPEIDNQILKSLASELRSVISEKKQKILNTIVTQLKIGINSTLIDKINSQLEDFPEIYWVAIPFRYESKDLTPLELCRLFTEDIIISYQLLYCFALEHAHEPNVALFYELFYSALEKSMGARKNIRKFEQPKIDEKGRKCSVCGERDVIFFKEEDNPDKFTRYNPINCDLTKNDKVPLKILAKGEGLCGLCFFKRAFEIHLKKEFVDLFDKFSFPSTSEVASSLFKLKALKDAKQQLVEYQNKLINCFLSNKQELPFATPLPKIKNLFNGLTNLEGELFYEENLRDKYLKENYGINLSEKEIKELKDALKKLYDKVGKPNPYYAIIHMDGDNMGKWLAGQLLPEIEHSYASDVWNEKLPEEFKTKLKQLRERKLLTPAIHASISTAFKEFFSRICSKNC